MQLPAYSRQPLEDQIIHDSFDLTEIGLCYSCLCKVVDMQNLVKLYGIPSEDITLAGELQRDTRWKDEVMEAGGSAAVPFGAIRESGYSSSNRWIVLCNVWSRNMSRR